ncbi:unnamed protein product, partial [Closterium sp. NIES-54]
MLLPRGVHVPSDGAQCGGRDFTTGCAGDRDGMGAAEPAGRGGCSTDSATGGAIGSGCSSADRVASGRCAGSSGGGHELVQSRASAERRQRESSECWSAEPNRQLGTDSVEDSRQRSRLGGNRCGRLCAQHVAERQLRLLRPALLLLALLSCGLSPLPPLAGPLAPASDAPARTRRSALLVGATRAYFPFFPSFAQSSGPNEASATLATSSKDSATNVTSAGDSKGKSSSNNGAPGGVLGLGTGPLSPLSQLAESGVVPRAGFALCLEGDDASAAGGGSHLLLGTTDAGPASGSTRVYKNSLSPFFYVEIKDMHLGTADLVVTPSMFPPLSSAGAGGTALDSSSAASVLPRPAYMALATAFLVQYPLMKFASSESAQEGLDCLDANDYHQASMTPAEFLQQFPPLTLVLTGGKGNADFTIAPTNYLKIVASSPHVVCFTVRMASSQAERAVIGDPWMRDKYLVIDTHNDTLSWIDAN